VADDILYQGEAIGIDARVTVGVGVLIIKTGEGRIIVSTTQDTLRELALRIHLELDTAEASSYRAPRR
jgi:hypothetical protein